MRSVAVGETAVLWLGPDEWLVLTAADRAEPTAAALRAALAGTHHAVVEVSDRMTGIGIAGAGHATCSMPAARSTCIHRPSRPVRSPGRCWPRPRWCCGGRASRRRSSSGSTGSFAPYAWLFLENAAREFGVAIAA